MLKTHSPRLQSPKTIFQKATASPGREEGVGNLRQKHSRIYHGELFYLMVSVFGFIVGLDPVVMFLPFHRRRKKVGWFHLS